MGATDTAGRLYRRNQLDQLWYATPEQVAGWWLDTRFHHLWLAGLPLARTVRAFITDPDRLDSTFDDEDWFAAVCDTVLAAIKQRQQHNQQHNQQQQQHDRQQRNEAAGGA